MYIMCNRWSALVVSMLCVGISNMMATMPRTPLGMPNINLTCYMNSGLQSLYQVVPLTKGLLSQSPDYYKAGSLARAYQQFVRSYTSSSTPIIDRSVVDVFYKDLTPHLSRVTVEAMQDVTEITGKLLESLQRDMAVEGHATLSPFIFDTESRAVCKTCGTVSEKKSTNNSLNVRSSRAETLRGCLEAYFSKEVVTQMCRNFNCPQSGYAKVVETFLAEVGKKDESLYVSLLSHDEDLKTYLLTDFNIRKAVTHVGLSPDVVTKLNKMLDEQVYTVAGSDRKINLVDFLNENKNTAMDQTVALLTLPQSFFISVNRPQQDTKRVSFVLEKLDVGTYLKAKKPEEYYYLQAVVMYNGGHYWAYVQNNGQWYKCDDTRTEPIDSGRMQKIADDGGDTGGYAYALFYQKGAPATVSTSTNMPKKLLYDMQSDLTVLAGKIR